jgi:siroheme synthase
MHGADRHLPVTCIENVSLPTQRAFVSDLGHFSEQLDAQGFDGPLIILVGIADTLAKQNLDVATAALQSGGVAVGSA